MVGVYKEKWVTHCFGRQEQSVLAVSSYDLMPIYWPVNEILSCLGRLIDPVILYLVDRV